MKAAVLYSGGKDSSFMAVMLKRLGLDVELCTANFGVYDSYIPASKSNIPPSLEIMAALPSFVDRI